MPAPPIPAAWKHRCTAAAHLQQVAPHDEQVIKIHGVAGPEAVLVVQVEIALPADERTGRHAQPLLLLQPLNLLRKGWGSDECGGVVVRGDT